LKGVLSGLYARGDQCLPNRHFIPGQHTRLRDPEQPPQGRTIKQFQVQDNASLLHGTTHSSLAGILQTTFANTFLPNINGTYTFADFNHFLQNSVATLNLTDGPPKFDFKEYDVAAYAGDDLAGQEQPNCQSGLRWEFSSQAINLLHAITVANQAGSTPLWSYHSSSIRNDSAGDSESINKYFGPTVGLPGSRISLEWLGEDGDRAVTYYVDPAYYKHLPHVATAAPVVNAGAVGTTPGVACTAPCLPTSGSWEVTCVPLI